VQQLIRTAYKKFIDSSRKYKKSDFPRLEQGFGVSGKITLSPSKPLAGFLRLAAIVFFVVTIKKSAIGKIAACPSG
jgi:hypothetical protein